MPTNEELRAAAERWHSSGGFACSIDVDEILDDIMLLAEVSATELDNEPVTGEWFREEIGDGKVFLHRGSLVLRLQPGCIVNLTILLKRETFTFAEFTTRGQVRTAVRLFFNQGD